MGMLTVALRKRLKALHVSDPVYAARCFAPFLNSASVCRREGSAHGHDFLLLGLRGQV